MSSDISATLRELSRQVALEESMSSTDHFLEAADQIAQQRGLVSPLRSTKRRDGDISLSSSAVSVSVDHAPKRRTSGINLEVAATATSDTRESAASQPSPRVTVTRETPSKTTEKAHERAAPAEGNDVQAVVNAIGVPLKKVDDGIDETINAKAHSGKHEPTVTINTNNNHHSAPETTVHSTSEQQNPQPVPRQGESTKEARERYLKRCEELKRQQEFAASRAAQSLDILRERQNSMHGHRGSVSNPAKVAVLLKKSDDKPWAKSLSASCIGSMTKEAMFRNTRIVKPQDAWPPVDNNHHRRSSSSLSARSSVSASSSQKTIDIKKRKEKMAALMVRLSRPASAQPTANQLKRDPTLRYTLLEEAQECTFHPNLRKTAAEKAASKQRDPDVEVKSTFVERMEAVERTRRTEMDDKIGKSAYDAQVDKKYCPSCTAKQSYDEVKEKRKKCPNCNVEYKRKTTWGQVSRQFMSREKQFEISKAENKEKIRKGTDDEIKTVERQEFDRSTGRVVTVREVERKFLDEGTGRMVAVKERERQQVDRETGKVHVVKELQPALFDKEKEKEFFGRMAEKLARREENIKRVEDDTYSTKCTFKPSIHKRAGAEEDDEEEDDDFDPAKAFMNRMEQHLNQRKSEKPELYLTKEDLPKSRPFNDDFIIRSVSTSSAGKK